MATRERAARALLEWWAEAGLDPPPGAPQPTLRADAGPPPPAPQRKTAALQKPKAEGPVEVARALAAQASDIESLAAAIAAFDGCPLKKSAKSTVVYDGAPGAPILLIGEAPGQDEDAAGKPFVGRAGQLLDQMLSAVGVSRKSNALISNCVYWRPPSNRNPTPEELAVCRPFVDRLVGLAMPKLVVLVGGVAAQSLLNTETGVMRLRGQRLQLPFAELTTPIHAMVMLHPAYLLRQPAQKRLAWADLLAMEAWLDELGAPRDPRL
jgi:DNA polymerase